MTKRATGQIRCAIPQGHFLILAAIGMEPFTYNHTRLFDEDSLLKMLAKHEVVAVHFEAGENESFGSMVVTMFWPPEKATNSEEEVSTPCWVIHENGLAMQEFISLLQILFSEHLTTKLVHGLHVTVHRLAFYGLDVSSLKNILDLQLYYEMHVDKREHNAKVFQIAKHCGLSLASCMEALNCRIDKSDIVKHLIPHDAIQAMVKTAKTLHSCFQKGVFKHTTPAERYALCETTARRWKYASQWNGDAIFWFDTSADFIPRSLECLGTEEEVENIVPHLQLQGEIQSLLQLLPEKFRDAILAVKDVEQKLVDVILDVGRVPHGYIGYRQRIELHNVEAGSALPCVQDADLALILECLGGEDRIGADNRAGIDSCTIGSCTGSQS